MVTFYQILLESHQSSLRSEVRESVAAKTGPMVFVGGLMADTIAAVPAYPGADERVVARSVVQCGGGPASTAAVAAARLGVTDVVFIGTVGLDATGDRLLDELSGEGIDVSGVSRIAGSATGASVIVVDVTAGSRAISARPGPPVCLNTMAVDLIGAARWVHVDHLGWSVTARRWHATTPGRRSRVSVDISYPVKGFTPDGVDLYAPNVQALAARYPECGRDIDSMLDRALADGARHVVVTRGSHGSAAATAAGDRYDVPAHPARVVSTLGAGDVFHGALLAALDRGDELPDAIRYAGAAAALSCRGVDGRSTIPNHRETLAALTGTAASINA